MRDLANRGVVITGAASGIGEALAEALAAAGARLLLADIDSARLQSVAERLRARGAACEWLATDVADGAAVQALAGRALALWGGADVIVNNAGVALVSPVESLAPQDAHWLMNINFWGVVHGCQAFLPQLRARPQALIVNISSIYAMISMPTQSLYNAAKAAVRGFSDALREELRGTGVRVLCVHPGGVRTRIVEQARLGDISAVADSPQALRSRFASVAPTSPAEAAAAIVVAMREGRTRLLVGRDARIADLLWRVFPTRASGWIAALARRQRAQAAKSAGKGPG